MDPPEVEAAPADSSIFPEFIPFVITLIDPAPTGPLDEVNVASPLVPTLAELPDRARMRVAPRPTSPADVCAFIVFN